MRQIQLCHWLDWYTHWLIVRHTANRSEVKREGDAAERRATERGTREESTLREERHQRREHTERGTREAEIFWICVFRVQSLRHSKRDRVLGKKHLIGVILNESACASLIGSGSDVAFRHTGGDPNRT